MTDSTKLEIAIRTIKFYASSYNYDMDINNDGVAGCAVGDDGGEIATIALELIEGGK